MWGLSLRGCWWLLAVVKVVAAGIACLSNPCSHGICIDDVNSTYACYCVDGYTGVQCQTNWDECWSAPCLNGGVCLDGVASYNCSCPDGFIGDNCETNYNECESNPCLNNATCVDMDNGYACACAAGFSGEHCEIDIAVCNSTEEARCYNGGQCIEGPGFKFYCKCTKGWTGKKCEDQIDECQSNPCQNLGVCIDVHADYMCACPFGYTGKSCEVQIEFCDDSSCSNDALCVVEDGARACYCVPDYHGERCELQYDECLLGPRCMNGGTCIDGVDNFTCSCPPRLTGSLCECLILDNSTYDCEYVSPTPFPESSTLFTSWATELATDTAVTKYPASFNDTEARTISETELETTTLIPITISVPTETVEDTTVSVLTTTQKNTENTETTSLAIVTTTAMQIDEYSTVTQATQTIESDDKILATTTECGETCGKITDSTEKQPPIEMESTTLHSETTTVQDATNVSLTTTESIEITFLPPVTTSTYTTTETPVVEVTTKAIEVTTHELDVTTQSMFTDAPTEQTTIDISTLSSTPLPFDITTVYDNTTFIYTTVQSECDDNVCNNQGTCIATPQGIRCHCLFNYKGRFCEDKIVVTSAAFGSNSYIAHKLKNTTSIAIEFSAKTLNSNGQLMLANIAKDVYMELFMNSGLLKFKFSCGYQTMLLSELKTYVNKGYSMKIETRLDLYIQDHHCNATLRLNDTLAMSGGQVANVTTIDRNSTLYLGNAPDSRGLDIEPFVGCITGLTVNGERREVFDEAFEALEVTECSSLSCLAAPCLNGGSCSDYGDGYTCSCANGWMGEHCNQSVCEHNPCQSGGSCVQHPGSGFLCLCPYGKHGIFCEYNVEITRPSLAPINTGTSSFLIYPLSSSASNSERFDLRLRFQTADMEQIALLVFVGQNGRHDSRSQHLALTFVKGYIMLTWNVGAGPRRVFTSRALSYRRGGHSIKLWRRGRTAGFSVDGRYNASGNAPAHDGKMATTPYVYIGGHPSENFYLLPHDLPLHTGWRGCIWEVGGQAVGSGKPIGGRGVGQCGVAQCTAKSCNAPRGVCIHSPATYGCICNEGWFGPTCASTKNPCDSSVTKCKGKCVITPENGAQCDCPYGKTGFNCDEELIPTDVLFTGVRSYVLLHPRSISSVSLSIEAEVKPNIERGLIVFAETPHFYTTLSIQGGLLEYRWTDRTSGVTSLVRSGVVLSMNQWHKIKSGRYGSRLYVWVDGALSTEAMAAHAYPHTEGNASIVLGGAEDLSSLPFDVMSGTADYYSGCIRHLHVNNIPLPLEQKNILEGQNLGDCDGTVCGSEACGGGSCAVEGGRARCWCAAGRCRRHAACGGACRAPRGACRGERCVCAAGYAGVDCADAINITTPQFDGGSLLSLGRKPSSHHSGEQRLVSNLPRPNYFSLNFTTAEPMGLILFLLMDNDYLGIGLENGFLKLEWSFQQPNFTDLDLNSLKLETKSLSRIIPRTGFLADGEWHILVMRLERNNITINVDHLLVYYEDVRLDLEPDYENVDVFIGGITEKDSALAKKLFPSNFKGCIDDIYTSEGIPVANYSELYSENVKSCQLFPLT